MADKRLNLSVLRNELGSLSDPAIRSLKATPPIEQGPGKLEIVRGPDFIGFKLIGTLLWTIDVRRFAGSPSLLVKSTAQKGVRIDLKGARFPGTDLSADFVCLLQKTGAFGTPMDLAFTLGGFQAHAILERWLAGEQLLESTVNLNQNVCTLGSTSTLAISGLAQTRFFPDWRMQTGGSGVSVISGMGTDISSNSFFLKLLFPGEPSVSTHPKSKRTRIEMRASGGSWDLKPDLTDLPIGKLTAAKGLFQTIVIETGESATGEIARELVASSNRDDALRLTLGGGITDLDDNPFDLVLVKPTYAIAFDPTPDHSHGDETFLTSRFAPTLAWLTVEGFAMQVGDASGQPGFEADTLSGNVTSVYCEPALLAVVAPLTAPASENIAARPFLLPAGARLPFVSAEGREPGWGVNAGPEVIGRRRLSLPDFSLSLLRREDLLSLEFLFYNIALEAGGVNSPGLVRKDVTKPAYVVVRFDAPQNIAEQAYLETYSDTKNSSVGDTFPPSQVTQALAAGPSRLAFQLPGGTNEIAFSLEALLDWVELEQSVAPVAQPDPSPDQSIVMTPIGGLESTLGAKILNFGASFHLLPVIREPLPTETAIEAPWRLFISPNSSGAWAHSTTAVTFNNRTELWHTRLAVRSEKNSRFFVDEKATRKIRAIWSPDYDPKLLPKHSNDPFRMSLDPNDRDQIVRLSSDFTIPNYEPKSIEAQKLFLTSLGSWMDVLGSWDDLPSTKDVLFSLLLWQHRAAMARDNYVRVVTAGWLLPFGHPASLVKITERKFSNNANGHTTAFLRQRFFIVVRQPEIGYDDLSDNLQRHFPYKQMRITTLVTPNLDAPETIGGFYSFFPKVNGSFFRFHLVGHDVEQHQRQTSEFSAPLYFVERGGDAVLATNAYNNQADVQTPGMQGQKIAYAASGKLGDTTLHTSTMTFNSKVITSGAADPRFYPEMTQAEVVVPAIQQLTGGEGKITIEYYLDYVATGLGIGEVYVQTKNQTPLQVGFNGKQSGGVATPNLSVTGLSRKFGTVSGKTPANVAGGTFDPSDIFSDVGAKLFGVIDLKDLVAAAGGDRTAPQLLTERTQTEIRTKLHWTPTLNNLTGGIIELTFVDPDHALTLDAKMVTPLGGGPAMASISGSLVNFKLKLAEVIGLTFISLSFNADAGKKLNVSADVSPGGLEFLGDLSFLNELRKYIPSDGFKDPPSLDITPEGLTAGYSLAIPAIGVGVFSIENIRLSAALTLPFSSASPLRFRFAFSEREHPFLITVSLLGGGGYFGITLGPDGVEMLEASIEVGANVSIDVVVASGNLHIMAGVYLKLDFSTKESQLTGYLRAGGSVDVLGLISASVEFYLGFTYYIGDPCKIAGEATITIEVHVLFFSASVHASLRREFKDPLISFADLIGPADWDYYCDSFAA